MSEPGYHLSAPRWRLWYRQRMVRGLENCRRCGVRLRHASIDPRGLRLGHLRARSKGGSNHPHNRTITCLQCEVWIGVSDMTGLIAPLTSEPQWLECMGDWGFEGLEELAAATRALRDGTDDDDDYEEIYTSPVALPHWRTHPTRWVEDTERGGWRRMVDKQSPTR